MMRGPSYDDTYLSRRMGGMSLYSPLTYGRTPSYLQPWSYYPRSYSSSYYSSPSYYRPSYSGSWSDRYPTYRSRYYYLKDLDTTSTTSRYLGYPPPQRYAPTPRPYYDDYYASPYYGGYSPYSSYGGYTPYGGAGYSPRMSRYDHYLDDDYDVTYPHLRNYRPSMLTDVEKDKTEEHGEEGGVATRSKRLRPCAIEPPPSSYQTPITEGDRHLARMQLRYPTLSEPQMLQDQVDKMRVRLKALAYSLDPSGPVPEIVVPERSKNRAASEVTDYNKKYTSAMEMHELPKLSTRRHHYYPEDEHMKDNLGIKCLSHYKNTRTQAGYYKPKLFVPTQALPDYCSSSRYSSRSLAKWEEPDTVYGPTTDKKPYSKVETGSSFFSTYGYTNRAKDTVATKVRDYYYDGDKGQADGGDEDDAKKERRKKKKSRERDELSSTEISGVAAESEAAGHSAEPTTPGIDGEAEPEGELDEKEKKRLEKKKRKAEREAAAKAAMEAELAALAEAEAELARLEAESCNISGGDAAAPAAEEAAEKSNNVTNNAPSEDVTNRDAPETAWLAAADDAAVTQQEADVQQEAAAEVEGAEPAAEVEPAVEE